MVIRLTKWFIFSVVIGILPIIWTGLRLLTQGSALSLESLFGRGDLLLVASALSAAAIGELFLSTSDRSVFKLFSGGGCLIVIMVSCLWYSDIVGYLLSGASYDKVIVSKLSIGLFVLSFLASAGSHSLAD